MKRFNLFFGLCIVAFTVFLVYACTKDNPASDKQLTTQLNEEEINQKVLAAMDKYNRVSPITELRGGTGINCYDVSDCQPKVTYTDTISMVGYGDCKAVVTWDQYWCPFFTGAGWIGTVKFDNFTAKPLAGSCDSVVMAWHNYELTNNLTQLEADLAAFVYAAQDIIRDKVMLGIANYLDVFIPCGGTNILLYAEFYTSNCKKECYKFTIVKGRPVFETSTVFCDVSCCVETTRYCWNSLNNTIEISTPTVSSVGSCPELSANPHTCPEGFFPLSESCQKDCNIRE